MAIQEEEAFDEAIDDEENIYDLAYVEPNDGDQLSCVLQRVLLTPKSDSHSQRHALFRINAQSMGEFVKWL